MKHLFRLLLATLLLTAAQTSAQSRLRIPAKGAECEKWVAGTFAKGKVPPFLVRLRRRALGARRSPTGNTPPRRSPQRSGTSPSTSTLYRPRDGARRRVPREDFRGFQRHGVGAPLPQHLRGEHPEDRAGEGRGHHPRIDSQGEPTCSTTPTEATSRRPTFTPARASWPWATSTRCTHRADARRRTPFLFQRPTAHGRHGRSHRMDR